MHKMRFVAAIAAVVCALAAQGRSMRWRSFDVHALLDDRGVLRVTEKQTIVFDGDWNGGERTFTVRPGQTLEFHGMSRIEDGREIPLQSGDLSQVDRWSMPSPNVVRWRSRMQDDPPFAGRELVYVLSYSLWGALVNRGNGHYQLQHNFTFEQRAGPIDDASVELRLDPVWRGVQSPLTARRTPLQYGDNIIIESPLEFTGRTAPFTLQPIAQQTPRAAALAPAAEEPVRRPLIPLAAFAALALIVWLWIRQERPTGRFEPLPAVDEAWIQEHILPLKAELAGAAYHDRPGEAEVTAVLARMAAENKLTITPDLHGGVRLHLNADRASLPAYERKLIEGLFFGGQNDVESWAIAAHYKESGFAPAWLIRYPLAQELDVLVPSWSAQRLSTGWWRAAVLLGLVGLVVSLTVFDLDKGPAIAWVLVAIGFSTVPAIYAFGSRRDVANLRHQLIAVLILNGAPILSMLALSLTILGVFRASLPAAIGSAIFAVASVTCSLAALRSRDLPEKLAFRRRIVAAREFFRRADEEPLPYLLALDLTFDHALASLAAGVTAQRAPSPLVASSNDDWSHRSDRGSDHDSSSSSDWGSSASSDSSSSSSSSSSSNSGGGSGGGW